MQVLRAKFPEGTEVFTEERLQAYADRIGLSRAASARYSWAFVLKLYAFGRINGIDASIVVAEIRRLEGLESPIGTKPATKFTKAPLRGLWHQHFFSARFVPQNILNQLQGGKLTANPLQTGAKSAARLQLQIFKARLRHERSEMKKASGEAGLSL